MVMVMPRDDEGQAMPAPTVVARAVGIVITRGSHVTAIVTWLIVVVGAVVMMTLPVTMRIVLGMASMMAVMPAVPSAR